MAVLAAPLVIPFAEALGLSVAILGMDKASDKVNQFIKDNPEESMKIFQMIMPAQGIANALKNKSSEEVEEKISLEDLEGMSDEEAQDLSKEDKAELMKQAGKSGGKNKRQTMIDISEKLGLSGEGKDKQDIEYEIDERYDEGGVEEVSKPKFDYKKFFKKRYADGGSIGIEVLFEEKKPRKDFSIGGQARPTDRVYDPRANVEDFTKALKSVSAGTTYQQQRQAQDYARQDASRRLSEAMRSGNQANIQGILQGVGGITSIPGMQFNRSGNRVTSVPATGPGRDKIINAMAQQMLNYTPSYQSLKPQPRDNLGLLMQDTIITDQMKSPAEMDAIRDRVLAAQKAQEQSYFMTDPVTGKKYSTEAEAIDDLGLVTYNQRFADGGRVGLFMGGDPLTGQALAIYNSMNAYGFDDQAIANALQEQGLYTPGGTTPDAPTQPVGFQGGNDGQDMTFVDRQDYSFNEKNYEPGKQLEINPAAFGVSFPDQPSGPKREGIINQAIDSFTSLPTRSLSSFASPTTGGNIIGPAEQGFMEQTLDIDPAGRTREEIRSLYDNYNRFLGRTSNYADARQKGKAGQLFANILGSAGGIPFLGKGIDMLSNLLGPRGDASDRSKFAVDNVGFGQGTGRDEFGVYTGGKTLFGDTTNYGERMSNRLNELESFFADKGIDINDPDAYDDMKKINSTLAKQVLAYQQRGVVDNINKRARDAVEAQKERQRQIELQKKIEAEAAAGKSMSQIGRENFTGEGMAFQAGNTDQGGGYTKGKVQKSSSVPGGYYGSPRKDGGLMYAEGGLVTMFKEKR